MVEAEMIDRSRSIYRPGGKLLKKMEKQTWMTVEEAANYLRVSTSTIYRMIRNEVQGVGILPHFRVGTRILFDREELLSWLRRGGACESLKQEVQA